MRLAGQKPAHEPPRPIVVVEPCETCRRLMAVRHPSRRFCFEGCKMLMRRRRLGRKTAATHQALLVCGQYLDQLRGQRDALARFLSQAGVAFELADVAEEVVA